MVPLRFGGEHESKREMEAGGILFNFTTLLFRCDFNPLATFHSHFLNVASWFAENMKSKFVNVKIEFGGCQINTHDT